ncbi:serine hydrolase domain-containing protein [Marinibacterium profundimaris]|uniref:serine hydrolase domain-containing protein n=1 Tax=Marinibacterium profundimaris TaxID=1679460 RepID=UPI000B51E952|nr:serine hydrolase [Marinibacterium profundimaris]
MDLMQGFPPAPEARVTLANWRTRPFSSWAFHHVREIVPSAGIRNAPGDVWQVEEAGPLIDPDEVARMVAGTNTDALVVMHQGRVVHELYRNGMTAEDPHTLMSVSKSVLGLLAGILAGKDLLDVSQPLTEYIPELRGTGYEGATVRQALDMQVGVAFSEDYTAAGGPIIAYRKAANWNPLEPGEEPLDLRSFQLTLKDSDGPHGDRFHYVSPVTDLMAWVMERATGTRYADLLSEHLWQPMGAERPGYITVDRIGGARAAGGVCFTARDLARLGTVIANGGRRGDGRQVVPEAWITDIFDNGDPALWNRGDFAAFYPGVDMHYRSKFYIHRGAEPLLRGVGIHGQYLFADPARGLSVAWFGSEADAATSGYFPARLALVETLRAAC